MRMEQGIYQVEVPISAVFAVPVEYPQEQEILWLTASLQMSALGLCVQFVLPLLQQVLLCF